jgi:hypothetical protein
MVKTLLQARINEKTLEKLNRIKDRFNISNDSEAVRQAIRIAEESLD